MKILINNQIVDQDDASLGIYDLGLNRGFGVFDFFRISKGKFRFFEDHLDRFLNSIKLSNIPFNYSREDVKSKIHYLREINSVINGYVRITLTGGDSPNFGDIPSESKLIVVVGNLDSNLIGDEGVSLISKFYIRSVPKIKTTNYFFAQMHRAEMLERGAVDILYYTDEITETSRANIFFVKKGKLYTPKSDILEGITRKKVLSLFPDTILKDIPAENMYDFDEVFICSSTKEITPVIKIDDTIIGNGKPGAVTIGVMRKFQTLIV